MHRTLNSTPFTTNSNTIQTQHISACHKLWQAAGRRACYFFTRASQVHENARIGQTVARWVVITDPPKSLVWSLQLLVEWSRILKSSIGLDSSWRDHCSIGEEQRKRRLQEDHSTNRLSSMGARSDLHGWCQGRNPSRTNKSHQHSKVSTNIADTQGPCHQGLQGNNCNIWWQGPCVPPILPYC